MTCTTMAIFFYYANTFFMGMAYDPGSMVRKIRNMESVYKESIKLILEISQDDNVEAYSRCILLI